MTALVMSSNDPVVNPTMDHPPLPTDDSPSSKQHLSSSAPADLHLHPTHCFFIPRHWGGTQRIPIYDISAHVDLSAYPSQAGDDSAAEPWFSAARDKALALTTAPASLPETYAIQRGKWYGTNFTLHQSHHSSGDTNPAAAAAAADKTSTEPLLAWKGGWHSARKNTLLFPANSRHCSHPLTMQTDSYLRFRDTFVVNSAPYEWHCLHRCSMRQFGCDLLLPPAGSVAEAAADSADAKGSKDSKDTTKQRKAVARLWQARKDWWTQSGVLVVQAGAMAEDGGADEVVLLGTAMVMLRKARQKTYEYSYTT